MKTLQQLIRLSTNRFYTFTDEELQRLADFKAGKEEAPIIKKKVSTAGNVAAVKSVGNFNKHSTGLKAE